MLFALLKNRWTGYEAADPTGVQLRTLQGSLRNLMAGKFKVETNWYASPASTPLTHPTPLPPSLSSCLPPLCHCVCVCVCVRVCVCACVRVYVCMCV